VPSTLLAVVGTAVAVVLAFKNQQCFSRINEALTVWGQITATSQMWAIKLVCTLGEPVDARPGAGGVSPAGRAGPGDRLQAHAKRIKDVRAFSLLLGHRRGERHLTWTAWLNVPASLFVGWTFLTLEKVGEASSNPFEGGANDVPISAIARQIEIEFKAILGEKTDLVPHEPKAGVLL
jgi:predicted membrane chloride channel (bestrophin family)